MKGMRAEQNTRNVFICSPLLFSSVLFLPHRNVGGQWHWMRQRQRQWAEAVGSTRYACDAALHSRARIYCTRALRYMLYCK